MKLTFLNFGTLDYLSGGSIYNKNLLSILKGLGHEVDYRDSLTDSVLAQIQDNAILVFDSLYLNDEHIPLLLRHCKRIKLYCLFHLQVDLKSRNEFELLKECYIIGTGIQSEEYLKKHGVYNTEKYTTIVPGIPNKWKTKDKKHPLNPRKLLIVSNLIPRKRVLEIIEVLGECMDYNWSCTICCNPSLDLNYTDLVKREINRSIDKNRFQIVTVPHSEVNDLYIEHDLFINFSSYESYGMAVAEAIASQIPIISTKVGNIQEFEKSDTIVWIDIDDKLDLRRSIINLLDHQNDYSLLVEKYKNFKPRRWIDVGQEFIYFLKNRK